MKLSEKRRDEAYTAIHDSIMDLRIKLNLDNAVNAKVDCQIAQLELDIWRKLKSALGINP